MRLKWREKTQILEFKVVCSLRQCLECSKKVWEVVTQPRQSERAGGVFKNKKVVAERRGSRIDTKSNSVCTSITNQKGDCVSQQSTQTLDRCSGAHMESL